MNSRKFDEYLSKRFNKSEIDAILQDAELEYQQTREAKMFGKKSYLEQLQDYLKPKKLICKPYFTDGYWHMGIKDKDDIWTMSGSDMLEDAARVALGKYKSWDEKKLPTPHEDALKAYCAENDYIFSFWDKNDTSGNVFVSNGIKIPTIGFSNLQEWRTGSPVGSKEDACERLLIDLTKDKSRKVLQEFCEQNGLTFSNEDCSRIKINSDKAYTPLYYENYGEALYYLRETKKARSWIWRVGPYEHKVKELCANKGWTLKTNFGMISIRELSDCSIESLSCGESGFKEVWENIRKLKALLE